MTFSSYFGRSFSPVSELAVAVLFRDSSQSRVLIESMLDASARSDFDALAALSEQLPRELRRSLAGEVIRTRLGFQAV